MVCQHSKIDDWVNHFKEFYTDDVQDCSKPPNKVDWGASVLVINYELAWRRPQLLEQKDFTLLLDESSKIKNEQAKCTKIFLGSKRPKIVPVDFENVILLSGTPTGGKYEELVTQSNLLGWEISKDEFWMSFVKFWLMDTGGYPIKIITGYKNVGVLKKQLRNYGAVFMKTEEVITLPVQTDIIELVDNTPSYKKFDRDLIITMDGKELVGETVLQELLYKRQIASMYNKNKWTVLSDMIASTEDRLLIFYNFKYEYELLAKLCKKLKRKISMINGSKKDLTNYEDVDNSVTLLQYQSGSMGHNLQKANKTIYFSPPLSSELYEQSKKRTHRIGQDRACFYYHLITKDSVDEKIMDTLKMRRDYTNELFKGRR